MEGFNPQIRYVIATALHFNFITFEKNYNWVQEIIIQIFPPCVSESTLITGEKVWGVKNF